MRQAFLAVLCLALAARATTAQVRNGSLWTDGQGGNTRVQVADLNPSDPAVLVTFIDATGFSGATGGTAASGSTTSKPVAQTSDSGTTTGGTSFRITGGKLYKKVNGKWVVQREIKKKPRAPKPKTRAEAGGGLELGEEGTSVPHPFAPKPL